MQRKCQTAQSRSIIFEEKIGSRQKQWAYPVSLFLGGGSKSGSNKM